MCDNMRRFLSIKNGLLKFLSSKPTGNYARHLQTMAFIINGIIASQSCNLPKIASKGADLRKPESRVRSFSRWLSNERIDFTLYFLPFAELLVRCLSAAGKPLTVIFDGSSTGKSCVALVASIVYKKRALPIAWIVRQGSKGHFPEELHLELAERVKTIIPSEIEVVFLGDGEFDGAKLITLVKSFGWFFVLRTAKDRRFVEKDESFSARMIGVGKDGYFAIANIALENDSSPGPMNLLVYRKQTWEETIYLLTNIEPICEAAYWYQKRFTIETFFSDQKSRGFHLHKSHISEPERLERLMMASCLAYIWIIFLGALAVKKGWHKRIHRTDRCDLSLFQLGLRLMDYRLNMAKFIPIQLTLFAQFAKSVR